MGSGGALLSSSMLLFSRPSLRFKQGEASVVHVGEKRVAQEGSKGFIDQQQHTQALTHVQPLQPVLRLIHNQHNNKG